MKKRHDLYSSGGSIPPKNYMRTWKLGKVEKLVVNMHDKTEFIVHSNEKDPDKHE